MTDGVIVIGAGIVGVSCARALQRAGKRVRIIDRQPPGRGCSFGNAGLIAIDHVRPLARPDVLLRVPGMLANPLGPLRLRVAGASALLPWLCRFAVACRPGQVARGTAALAALLREAMPAWERASGASGLDSHFRRVGALVVFEHEATRAAAATEEHMLAAHGVRFAGVDRAEVRRLAPGIAAGIAGGRFYPDAAHVLDPHAVVAVVAERFAADGGMIERRDVRGFTIEGNRVTAVRTATGDLPAAQVVLAAGAGAVKLARWLGIKAPIAAERGYHVMVDAGDLAPEMSLTFAERGFVMTPMRDGLRLAGTVELGAGAEPDWRRAAILGRHAGELFPGRHFRERSRWFGDRPTLPDYLPMIGRSERFENALVAVGHQHLGLTLAAITGELVRDLALGRTPAIDVSPFRCGRFGVGFRRTGAGLPDTAVAAAGGSAPPRPD